MDSERSERCGFTWPQDHRVDDEPDRQSCCYRTPLESSDRCAWHTPVDGPVKKAVPDLLESREPRGMRDLNETTDGRPGPTFTELLDGARLSGLQLRDEIALEGVSLRGADLEGVDLSEANLTEADLRYSDLRSADLTKATLAGAVLSNADASGAIIRDAVMRESITLWTDFEEASFSRSDVSQSFLAHADFARTSCLETDFSASWMADVDLSDAKLQGADLSDTSLGGADLTNASMVEVNLSGADMERAVLSRCILFDADLTGIRPWGATIGDVRINEGTVSTSWTGRGGGLLGRPSRPRCAYDSESAMPASDDDHGDDLQRAADTYRMFEEIARTNSFPRLQSTMFVLRQDVQRRRYWEDEDYLNWAFASVSRGLFRYGESFGRILGWSMVIVLGFAILYWHFGLVVGSGGGPGFGGLADAIYFSTLTYTTLGFGDFQPVASSGRLLATLEAAIGAIMIALFVFVLGRRAAR